MQEYREQMNFMIITENESICSNDLQDAMYFMLDRYLIINVDDLLSILSKPTTILEQRFVKDIRDKKWNIDINQKGYLAIILRCNKKLDILTYEDYLNFFETEGTIEFKFFEAEKEAEEYVNSSFKKSALNEHFILLDEQEYFFTYKKEIELSIYLGFSLNNYMSEYLCSISEMTVEGLTQEYDYLCEFGRTNIENEMRMLVIEKLIEKNNI